MLVLSLTYALPTKFKPKMILGGGIILMLPQGSEPRTQNLPELHCGSSGSIHGNRLWGHTRDDPEVGHRIKMSWSQDFPSEQTHSTYWTLQAQPSKPILLMLLCCFQWPQQAQTQWKLRINTWRGSCMWLWSAFSDIKRCGHHLLHKLKTKFEASSESVSWNEHKGARLVS